MGATPRSSSGFRAFVRERAFKVFISPAHNRIPLLPITIQALVLRKLDHSHGPIFCCPSRYEYVSTPKRVPYSTPVLLITVFTLLTNLARNLIRIALLKLREEQFDRERTGITLVRELAKHCSQR